MGQIWRTSTETQNDTWWHQQQTRLEAQTSGRSNKIWYQYNRHLFREKGIMIIMKNSPDWTWTIWIPWPRSQGGAKHKYIIHILLQQSDNQTVSSSQMWWDRDANGMSKASWILMLRIAGSSCMFPIHHFISTSGSPFCRSRNNWRPEFIDCPCLGGFSQ